MIDRKFMVVAMVSRVNERLRRLAYADDDEARQIVSINSPNPKVEDSRRRSVPEGGRRSEG
jgi:hypothetical protein